MRDGQQVDFDALWDYAQPAQTEAAFRALLPAAEAAGDLDYWGQLLTQIARTAGLQRRFAEAHALLDKVEGMLGGETAVFHIRYHLERGRCYNSAGDKTAARPQFLTAYALAKALAADFYTIDALHMLAIVDPPAAQIDWNEQALAIAQQATDPKARRWIGSLTNNLGWTYHEMGDYERALALFEQALAFRQTQGDEALVRIADWCVARCLRSLGRVAEAHGRQQQLAQAYAAADEPSGYVFEELGECLLQLGDVEAARPYLGQAYQLLAQDSWLVANEPDRLARLKQLWQND